MGTGSVIDHFSSVDVAEGSGTVTYGWARGTEGGAQGDFLRHAPSFGRAEYIAVVDAAQVSQAAWESHVQAHHQAAWSWLSALTPAARAARYEADRLIRGL